jgi:integrase
LLAPIESSDLSEVTKRNYRTKVRQLVGLTGKSLRWVLKHPTETLEELGKDGRRSEAATRRTYASLVLGIFKYNPALQKKIAEAFERWSAAFKKADDAVMEKYDTLTPSERQTEAFVPWERILQIRDDLSVDQTAASQDYLVLAMYTMIPPVRADLGEVRIWRSAPGKNVDVERHANYLLIGQEEEEENMTLVLTEFKTSKTRKQYSRQLPARLCMVISESLRETPRKFLLVSPSTGKPFGNASTFSNYVARVLKRTLGTKHASINMLRHSFVTSLDFNKMTPRQIEETASALMHSPDMMSRYRLWMPTDEREDQERTPA